MFLEIPDRISIKANSLGVAYADGLMARANVQYDTTTFGDLVFIVPMQVAIVTDTQLDSLLECLAELSTMAGKSWVFGLRRLRTNYYRLVWGDE